MSGQKLQRWIVSVVMVKESVDALTHTTNTMNKLYDIRAVSQDEAHGIALKAALLNFPEHRFHTIRSMEIE